MNEITIVEKLLREGYDRAYVWDAEPGESDPSHSHLFETKLIIIAGNIEIEMDNKSNVLKKGDMLEIPRQKIHSGKAGPEGCRYIVAEKH